MMILFILRELQLGENSFWHPLFKIWPQERDLLWKWTDEELQELQDDDLYSKVMKQRKNIREEFENMYEVCKQYPDVF